MAVSVERKHDKDTETAKAKLTDLCTLTMQSYQHLLGLEPLAAAPLALQQGICIPTDPVSLSLTINNMSRESITATVADALVQSVFTQVRLFAHFVSKISVYICVDIFFIEN